MILVQDQYTQNSRKNFDSELQLNHETSKQLCPEPQKCWDIGPGCEEEILTSGNETEGEDAFLFADVSKYPEETSEIRRAIHSNNKISSKNVRFEGPDFICEVDSETSSVADGYLEECRCADEEPSGCRHCQGTEISHKSKGHCQMHLHQKCRTLECSYDKKYNCDRKPERSANYSEPFFDRRASIGDCIDPIKPKYRLRRKEHKCGRLHCDFEYDHELGCGKFTHRAYKFEHGENILPRHHHGDCCDHWPLDEGKIRVDNKSFVKMKPLPLSAYKRMCSKVQDQMESYRKFTHYTGGDHHYRLDEFHDYNCTPKNKKKTLDAVQEQQEYLSDSAYKVPCSKFSSLTVPGELVEFTGKKSSEKLTNTSQSDWLYYGKSNDNSLGERLRENRIYKMRSRRTRINKLKNGWKKALVQTVRDGTRNERVGVIVMGSKGPEFYSKNSKTSSGIIPFRRSKSSLDGAAKSFEVMTVDCKNVFLSSSEPCPRTNCAMNELVCPEDESKMEEKLAKFSKNVNDIVKSSEEKFYKALSNNEFQENKKKAEGIYKGAGEGTERREERIDRNEEETEKVEHGAFKFLPVESLSPKVPKSLRRSEKKVSEESKAMADSLNEKARQFKESQCSGKDESFIKGLKELREKYPPKELSPETIEANLSLWGMKLNQLTEGLGKKEHTKETEKENNEDHQSRNEDEKEKEIKDEGSSKTHEPSTSNKPKYCEQKTNRKLEDIIDDTKSESTVSKSAKKETRVKKWPESLLEGKSSETDPNKISAVFRDLVENGCAISQGESENLQNIINKICCSAEGDSNDTATSTSSEVANVTVNDKIARPKSPTSSDETKDGRKKAVEEEVGFGVGEKPKKRSLRADDLESYLKEINSRKVCKMKNQLDEKVFDSKLCKKVRSSQREGKSKKKIIFEDKMKLLREALPSIAAENEAAHLKQLKKYIDRFIDRVEASTTSEFRRKREIRLQSKESISTDSSQVRIDARKILDFVSNPFRKISSDVTINVAKKLTDALVQDRTPKTRRNSDNEDRDDEGFVPFAASSESERYDEPEPTYLRQLKKMRSEHLNNIVLEVKRLSDLLRFLDRCSRLNV